MFITDVHALGLKTAQGLIFTESWYWDANDANRAFAKDFAAANGGKHPTMVHAGVYSSVIHYLKAVEAMKNDADGAAVVAKMKEMPTDDKLFGKGSVRADGRKIHDMYLFEVKKPEESKSRGTTTRRAPPSPPTRLGGNSRRANARSSSRPPASSREPGGLAQRCVDPALPARAGLAEMRQDVGVEAQRDSCLVGACWGPRWPRRRFSASSQVMAFAHISSVRGCASGSANAAAVMRVLLVTRSGDVGESPAPSLHPSAHDPSTYRRFSLFVARRKLMTRMTSSFLVKMR